jgi:long-chain fatty acid transport protein
MRIATIAALAVAGATAGPARAVAAGFAAARFGGEHGNVTASNPTALYFNPAGLAFAPGARVTLFADGVLALRAMTWDRPAAADDVPDPPGAEGANAGRAHLFNVLGGPMLAAAVRLDRLTVAAGFFVPFGGRARWDRDARFAEHPDFPLAADGVQRWHAIQGALTFMYFSAGAAYRAGRIAFGVSANLIRSSITMMQAQNPLGAGDPDTAREGRTSIDVRGIHGSFGAGVLVEAIANRLWLGAGYQAQPALGPMQLDGTLVSTYQDGRTELPVTLHQALPDVFRLGAKFRPAAGYELRLHGDVTRWSVMQTQCVGIRYMPCAVYEDGADATPNASTLRNLRRHWRDSVAVRAGGSAWLHPAVETFAGLGFETGAVPDHTLDPGLADGDSLQAAAGARFQASPSLFVAASYTHVRYFDRDNVGRSGLDDAGLATRRPDGGGRYQQWLGVLNLNVEKRF